MSHLIFNLGKVIMHEILTLSITLSNTEREEVRLLYFSNYGNHHRQLYFLVCMCGCVCVCARARARDWRVGQCVSVHATGGLGAGLGWEGEGG